MPVGGLFRIDDQRQRNPPRSQTATSPNISTPASDIQPRLHSHMRRAHNHRSMPHTDITEIVYPLTRQGTCLRFHRPFSFVETSTSRQSGKSTMKGGGWKEATIQPSSPLKTAATGPVGALGGLFFYHGIRNSKSTQHYTDISPTFVPPIFPPLYPIHPALYPSRLVPKAEWLVIYFTAHTRTHQMVARYSCTSV